MTTNFRHISKMTRFYNPANTTSKIQSVMQTSSFGNDTTWLKAVSPAHFRNINLKGTFAFPVDHYRERLFGEEAIVAQA